MTFEEFSDKYEEYLLKLTSKKDFPRWFDVQLKTQGSRNITIDTWNRVITLLGYVASDDRASTELLDDIVKVLNTLKEQLGNKLDSNHFTSSDIGKFIAIGPDGSFVAVAPPSGGEGGGSGGIQKESDPTVPAWAKQPNKPTYTASEVGAVSETEFSEFSELYSNAVSAPTYDTDTGTMTFQTIAGKVTVLNLSLENFLKLTNGYIDKSLTPSVSRLHLGELGKPWYEIFGNIYYFFDASGQNSQYGFGMYQWGDNYTFVVRNGTTNAYISNLWSINGATKVTDFIVKPTVGGYELVTSADLDALGSTVRQSIAANKSSIDVLNGDASTEGSVKKQIAEAIAAIMENPDTSMNSIQELVDWVNNHASDALALSNKASANETAIGRINALLGTSLPATTNASTVIGYITEIADKLATETSERKAADTQLQKNIDAEASARATEISDEITRRANMDNYIRENAVFGVELSGQDLVFRNDHDVELQNNRITLPVSSGEGGSAVATLSLQYFELSESPSYNIVKLSENLYGARLLLTSAGASCTYGTTRKVPCVNWSEVSTQDFTVVVGDSPLHTDYYYKWDYSETNIEGLAYMVNVTLNRSSGLLTIATTSRNYLSYFPEFDYYVELEINTAIKRAMVRVTQLKIY